MRPHTAVGRPRQTRHVRAPPRALLLGRAGQGAAVFLIVSRRVSFESHRVSGRSVVASPKNVSHSQSVVGQAMPCQITVGQKQANRRRAWRALRIRAGGRALLAALLEPYIRVANALPRVVLAPIHITGYSDVVPFRVDVAAQYVNEPVSDSSHAYGPWQRARPRAKVLKFFEFCLRGCAVSAF